MNTANLREASTDKGADLATGTFEVLDWPENSGIVVIGNNGGIQPFEMDKSKDVEYAFRWAFMRKHFHHLQGEILTILDAVVEDDRRLKATKDLAREKFSSKIDWLLEQSNNFSQLDQ